MDVRGICCVVTSLIVKGIYNGINMDIREIWYGICAGQ
jgi:hypothetical protein